MSESRISKSTPSKSNPTSEVRGLATFSASGAGEISTRPIRRRALKACIECRQRKVRCDVVERGSPCGNCQYSCTKCIVRERKRKRDRHIPVQKTTLGEVQATPVEEQATPVQEHDLGPAPIEIEEDDSVLYNIFGIQFEIDKSSLPPLPEPDEDIFPHQPHLLYRDHCQKSAATKTRRAAGLPSSLVQRRVKRIQNQTRALPPYMKALPPCVTDGATDYLLKKGAFELPAVGLRDELLGSYIEFVHGYMPILELNSFLGIIEHGDGETGRLSILLFQAVMFAGTAFVDMKYLRAVGFSTRKAARKAFYGKVRYLYDFDCESDKISIVQALLLMTYWSDIPDDQKDIWHWLGIAISLSESMSLSKHGLWKRIRWSCFMRDRLVALAMGRPTRIRDEDFDVPGLTLDDFERDPVPNDISCINHKCVVARDAEILKQLAEMCVEKTKLCICIGHVLTSQYSARGRYPDGVASGCPMNYTTMLVPKGFNPDPCDIDRCDIELENWRVGLTNSVFFELPVTADLASGRISLTVHGALLQMLYLTTLSTLHRPQALVSESMCPTSEYRALQVVSGEKVHLAASKITQICQEMYQLSLVRFLPTTAITVITPAVIIHLLDMKSLDEERRSKGVERFYNSMRVLHDLRNNYAAAELASTFLFLAVDKAGIRLEGMCGGAEIGRLLFSRERVAAFTSSPEEDAEQTMDIFPTTFSDSQSQPDPDHENDDREELRQIIEFNRAWNTDIDHLPDFLEGHTQFAVEDEMLDYEGGFYSDLTEVEIHTGALFDI